MPAAITAAEMGTAPYRRHISRAAGNADAAIGHYASRQLSRSRIEPRRILVTPAPHAAIEPVAIYAAVADIVADMLASHRQHYAGITAAASQQPDVSRVFAESACADCARLCL